MNDHSTEKFRILVIDDEASILEQFQQVLAPSKEIESEQTELNDLQIGLFGSSATECPQVSFDLTLCHQGDEGMEKVRQALRQSNPFAVAFIDMRMPPGRDGLWTAEHIREIDKNIQIVIVTAFSDVSAFDVMERVKPHEKLLYVQKPFHPQEMRQFATALSARWLSEQQTILDSTNAALRESDHLKKEFIIAISHELRTPLAIFKNVISNAIAGVMGQLNKKLQENLEIADHSLNRLSKLITDFLDLADMDAGELHLDLHPTAIQQVIKKAIACCRGNANAKKIKLTAIMPQTELAANIDQKRMMQVLRNLIDNAVKYVQEGGHVDVRLSELDNELRIIVEDNGPGIERNDIDRVFNRFIQIRRQVGPGQHGTGLGLTIAKTIVELHGGRIWIESIPGDGASFCFTLPKYLPAAQPQDGNDEVAESSAIQSVE